MLIYLHCGFRKKLYIAIQTDLKWGQKAPIQTLHIVTFMDLIPTGKSFITKARMWYRVLVMWIMEGGWMGCPAVSPSREWETADR